MHCDLIRSIVLPRILGAQRPIFSGLRFFNEPEISDSVLRICAQDFYVLKKSIDLSRV